MGTKYSNDPRIFSLYMSEVMQTLEPIEMLHLTAWMAEERPEIFDDLSDDIRRIYDITLEDFNQFAEQVIEFEETVAEEAAMAEWIASE